ncbi:MAG: acylphosphatase [Planctomycetes bacterium]|nr:acylphosphatase [Planctomycetota bacterium]MCB9868735.1 acylphosphatase [Planctomycetota bacterium]MCB9888747.1 acylphosphatase [Planctomycetota bacterium]
MERVLRVLVAGRVQGVAFRWATCEQARKLGVRGWVRNRRDGCVEAHLEGQVDAVDALLGWLHTGPPQARVDKVEAIEACGEGAASFEVGDSV